MKSSPRTTYHEYSNKDSKSFWRYATQGKKISEDFLQMKMNPLLALILWASKSKVFEVHAQPELSCSAVSPSQPVGLIFGNFYGGGNCQLRGVL